MNEELARIVYEAFHRFWKEKDEDYEYLPFDVPNVNYPSSKEAWSEVGEAAIKWFLDSALEVKE